MGTPEDSKDAGGESGTRLTAAEIHDNLLAPGEEELHRPTSALLWSSLGSGLVIGFSFLAGGWASEMAGPRYGPAAAAAVYPLGFIFVILARSELFTENTLTPVLPFLNQPTGKRFKQVLRVWAALLMGNLVGAAVFALVVAHAPVVAETLRAPLLALARQATDGTFAQIFLLAIFAGWLIALLAWLLASTHATGAQLALIWIATAPISALGFRHSIAGAVEAFYRSAVGDVPLGAILGDFVLPAVLGNAVGGVVLVALLNYGQVTSERPTSVTSTGAAS
jgi:formate-nitrite transporter family protein